MTVASAPGITDTMRARMQRLLEAYAEPPPAYVAGGAKRSWRQTVTPAEINIACLFGMGYSNDEAADRSVISVKTVEAHKAHLAEKLGIPVRRLAHALTVLYVEDEAYARGVADASTPEVPSR